MEKPMNKEVFATQCDNIMVKRGVKDCILEEGFLICILKARQIIINVE